jgi:hypothetical protein
VQGFWVPKRASPRMRVVPRRQHCPSGPFRSPAIGWRLDVVDNFTAAVNRWETPTSVLTDGANFTATPSKKSRSAPMPAPIDLAPKR